MKTKIDQNKRERTSWIILIVIVVSGLSIPEAFKSLNQWSQITNEDRLSKTAQEWESIDSLYSKEKKNYETVRNDKQFKKKYSNNYPKKYPEKKPKKIKKHDVFNKPSNKFDPNSAPDSLLLWIFPDKVARNLIKYRNSGGRFYKKEALQKIYGMEEGLYDMVADFIDIPRKSPEGSTQKKFQKPPAEFEKTNIIEINTADSSAWATIRGIGPVLANRIVKFRDRLGGFHSLDQVGETYGLEAEVFNSFKNQLQVRDSVSKLDINHAGIREISRHPYVNKKQASWIVKYRAHHGEFQNAEDLLKIRTLDTVFVNRLSPYFSFRVSTDAPLETISLKQ